MAATATRLGLLQAASGAAGGLLWVSGWRLGGDAHGGSGPDDAGLALQALGVAMLALAVLLFRRGRQRLALGNRPLGAGELLLMAGAAAIAVALVAEVLGTRAIPWVIGFLAVVVGHVVLAAGLVRLPGAARLLALGPVAVVAAAFLWFSVWADEESYPHPEALAWPIAWAAFHVVAGIALPLLAARRARGAAQPPA